MPAYKAPLRDIRFVLEHVVRWEERAFDLPSYAEHSLDTVDAILEEAARFCENELQPLNRSGDEEGCHFEGGAVRTPQGFKDAYRKFADGGWPGMSCAVADGGMDLPKSLSFAVDELICSANLSFGLYPGLSHGAYDALRAHATDRLKGVYLPKIASGEWSGTMCLTEPQCGTDLGLIKTTATPSDDGAFRLRGTKIFISAGEHDLSENIVHLVLARLPDAPAGVRGISLFVCPKFVPDEGGGVGPRNGVTCGAIEKKMGIKASSTCVMNFDDARAWLVGEPHRGLPAMFTMMNSARLAVGIQGLGVAEAAYQGALEYARTRLQMRAPTGPKHPDQPADPIIVHPDVRRMLMHMKVVNEGCRALALWVGGELDASLHHPDPARRQAADDLVALMTPVVKAFLTDHGFAAANLGMQVFGGHGYIREWGMEQLVRDARITQIYEGTNGIQALDLVGRKLPIGMGRLARRFFHPLAADLDRWSQMAEMREFADPMAKAFGRLQQASLWLGKAGTANPDEIGAAASDYLRIFALVAVGSMWCRMVEAASRMSKTADDSFARAKLESARYYMAKILPEAGSLLASITAGSGVVMALADDNF
ncbi:MAG TPA: acyl-CoA dehydrogenase C-terminal domain-containing protein [Methylomirabilota bacterium]|nr:acyl-CoA dehydrogenase C-terminal domain-containing protein [Methylomirabilota bacterium]